MERVVIYTPAEDFFYNGDGAYLLVAISGIICSLLIGYMVSMLLVSIFNLGRQNADRATAVGSVLFGIVLFVLFKHFFF